MKKMIEGGKMPWGKFKGCFIHFVEDDYLDYVINNCDWDDVTLNLCEDEIARRSSLLFGVSEKLWK